MSSVYISLGSNIDRERYVNEGLTDVTMEFIEML